MLMRHRAVITTIGVLACAVGTLRAADWAQFRGPGGLAVSEQKNLPVSWSAEENLVWKADLPGPGASSPVVVGHRVYVTCYTGYGLEPNQGDQQDLVRHLLCFDRRNGGNLWHKQFAALLPEHEYQGEGSYHGYSASTPASDGERLFVFFGKSGVFCFDLDGSELWHVSVGEGINGWGSGTSPVLYNNLVIVNASVECGALVALDKNTGQEVWRAEGIHSSWNTPLLVTTPAGQTELVVSIEGQILSFDPATGEALWNAEGIHRYVCPSVVAHDGIVYAIGGGHTSLAIRSGGRGDVTSTHTLWRKNDGSNVPSPIYYNGYLYWAHDGGGVVCCQDPKSGEMVYQERLVPDADRIWASPVLADGKLYYVSQNNGVYVVAVGPEYRLLSHNRFEDDDSRTNASPAVAAGQLLLRTDRRLYCIGSK
jgi:outer membrane protein assembly factor BamB